MKITIYLFAVLLLIGCGRTLKKDYKVVDASKQETPEWVEDLAEWVDDEEDSDEVKKHKYYVYTSEAKNQRQMACEIAKAKTASTVAAEISTYIKDTLAQSVHGDPTKKGGKLAEYVQNDLYKEVQATIVGARVYRTYWEKRRFLKEEGAKENWDGFVCSSLIKVPKANILRAFSRAEKKLVAKADDKAKEQVKKMMKEAAEKY